MKTLAGTTLTATDAGKKGTTYTVTFPDGTTYQRNSKREYTAALVVLSNDLDPNGADEFGVLALSARAELAAKNPYRKWDCWAETRVVTLEK